MHVSFNVQGDIIVLIYSLKMFQNVSHLRRIRSPIIVNSVGRVMRAILTICSWYHAVNMYNVSVYCHVGNLLDMVVKARYFGSNTSQVLYW